MKSAELKVWVLRVTRDNLQKFAARMKPEDISATATAGDVKRAAHQCRKLAERLDGQLIRASRNTSPK